VEGIYRLQEYGYSAPDRLFICNRLTSCSWGKARQERGETVFLVQETLLGVKKARECVSPNKSRHSLYLHGAKSGPTSEGISKLPRQGVWVEDKSAMSYGLDDKYRDKNSVIYMFN